MREIAADIKRLAQDLCSSDPANEFNSASLWEKVRELGLDRIGIEEDRGGSGGSIEDLATTVSAFAEQGVTLPFVENAAAMMAFTADGRFDEDWATFATGRDEISLKGETVSGFVRNVPWMGSTQTAVIHVADIGLIAVTTAEDDVRVTDLGVSIAGEPLATVVLDNTKARVLEVDAKGVIARWQLLDMVALVGFAHGAHSLTRGYVKQRVQFGKPLIEIPSVAANLAQMSIYLLLADAAIRRALETVDLSESSGTLTSTRVVVAQATTTVARISHQLHGAMGTTREYPLHRFTRNIWARRDRANSQHAAALNLGRIALNGGEPEIWDVLTR